MRCGWCDDEPCRCDVIAKSLITMRKELMVYVLRNVERIRVEGWRRASEMNDVVPVDERRKCDDDDYSRWPRSIDDVVCR
jgi:hypothetical protein